MRAHVHVACKFTRTAGARRQVRIYVLEDPGIPNNAVMLRDEYYQRCVPTAGGAVIDGGSLGPCPMCQNSGEVTYGAKHAPAVPEGDTSMATFIGNVSAADPTFLPVENRVWCAASSDGRAYGDGKAEPAAEHGRLVRRKFAWTPLPAQGVCDHATECVYVVRVQAFDSFGMPSTVKVVHSTSHQQH